MSTTTELRELASALPGVEEGTHFRLAALRVSGTVFAVLQSDDHAVLHVDAATAEDAAVHPAVEKTHRGTTLIGIRIHLPDTDRDVLQPLLAAAWRHRAPAAEGHPLTTPSAVDAPTRRARGPAVPAGG